MLSEVHKPHKAFTLEEATRTLPLVTRILRDIVEANREFESLQERLRARQHAPADATDGGSVLEDAIRAKLGEIEGFLEELRSIGCECKDPRLGLVDFPAVLGDRIVLLCWRLGEPEIAHWHEVDAGFRGRKPVRGVFS